MLKKVACISCALIFVCSCRTTSGQSIDDDSRLKQRISEFEVELVNLTRLRDSLAAVVANYDAAETERGYASTGIEPFRTRTSKIADLSSDIEGSHHIKSLEERTRITVFGVAKTQLGYAAFVKTSSEEGWLNVSSIRAEEDLREMAKVIRDRAREFIIQLPEDKSRREHKTIVRKIEEVQSQVQVE